MTYAEAIEMGYRPVEQKWQRGYISRKTSIENQQVMRSGRNGKGCAYILLPSWKSTTYCVRQYLADPIA